jgi:hypothetical protein
MTAHEALIRATVAWLDADAAVQRARVAFHEAEAVRDAALEALRIATADAEHDEAEREAMRWGA